MQKIKAFIKKEVVLCVALALAAVSAFFVRPDRGYIDYIDFRTLAILFCLMGVMAGLQKIGVFQWIAERLLGRVHADTQVVLILVMLCFFFSMLITNDVALITFVPFTFTVGKLMGEETYRHMALPVVVLQTIAANLGSMMTPIGNPQNLYLYGLSGMGTGEFLLLMLPYTLLALALLTVCCVVFGKRLARYGDAAALPKEGSSVHAPARLPRDGEYRTGTGSSASARPLRDGEHRVGMGSSASARLPRDSECRVESGSSATARPLRDGEHRVESGSSAPAKFTGKKSCLLAYLILFALCLLTVARILNIWLVLVLTVGAILVVDRKVFARIDYCLLLTFVGFFIFIGNMGRVPAFSELLQRLVAGNEVYVSILASQCISNVPAALLLSGFTADIPALVVGVNLGGLGTLIASMASLISYKYVAAETEASVLRGGKGRYFRYFTVANICFLVLLVALYICIR